MRFRTVRCPYTRSPAFVSNNRDSTYFAVALRPTSDKQWQTAGGDIAASLSNRPGVVVGGAAVAQDQVNKQVEQDLRMAEMLAFPLLFLLSLLFFRSLVAAMLRGLFGAVPGHALASHSLCPRTCDELLGEIE